MQEYFGGSTVSQTGGAESCHQHEFLSGKRASCSNSDWWGETKNEVLQRFKKEGCVRLRGQAKPRIRTVRASLSKSDGYGVNKGTKTNPHMKCRRVAQEHECGTRMDEFHANTLSLSCIKLAMLYAAQKRQGRKRMTLDVKSAFLRGANCSRLISWCIFTYTCPEREWKQEICAQNLLTSTRVCELATTVIG